MMAKKRVHVPPPTIRHPDRKKEADRTACRGDETRGTGDFPEWGPIDSPYYPKARVRMRRFTVRLPE